MADSNPTATKRARRQSQRPGGHRSPRRLVTVIVIVAVLSLIGLFLIYRAANSGTEGATTSYAVGEPGPGEAAPDFDLFSSAGGTVSLTSLQGKSTLLYFQEGLTCQPCWDQIKDLERSSAAVKAAGVDQVVSITTDPADLIAQKTSDEGLTTPVLSDPDLAVSRAYHANDYGMMGDSRNGHTFLLVDPQGQITWRADYGGPPDFTMFVPVSQLLADLKSASSS